MYPMNVEKFHKIERNCEFLKVSSKRLRRETVPIHKNCKKA